MKLKSKLFYTLGSVGLVSLTAVAAVSCGDSTIKLSEKIGDVVLVDNGKKIVATDNRKTILITDAGKVTDKSFNQSGWEGIILAADQHNLATSENISSIEPRGEENIDRQYQTAQSQGFKNWFLPGFRHDSKVKKYWKENKEALKKNKTVVVGIDFQPNVKTGEEDAVDEGHGIGVLFDVKQSAFIVGYAVADYLAKKYPSDSTEDVAKRSVYSFGGGEFFGVTDFIYGFFKGVENYNKKPSVKKTKILTDQKLVPLNSGFVTTGGIEDAATKSVSSNATVILPVAGPATGVVLSKLTGANNADKIVVGVDVDQALSQETFAERFFSSITKRIAQASYDVQTELYGPAEKYNILKGFKIGEKSVTIMGNIKNNLVGYAKSSLKTADKTLADASLAEGKKVFDAATDLKTLFDDETNYIAANKAKTLPKFLGDLATKISE